MQNTAEDISHQANGHKANLSNPNTSDASKQHSKQVLEQLGGEQAFYGKQGEGDIQQNPGNVAGGLKAAINNPEDNEHYVSEEGKQQAKDKLNITFTIPVKKISKRTMNMDDLEIDPAIAEAMGFTSFGSKRRKHAARADDAFIDDSSEHIPASTGANDILLGTRAVPSETKEKVQEQGSAEDNVALTKRGEGMQEEQAKVGEAQADNWTPGFPSPQELAALRRGIKNARGDMVVFLPSFIEDPWKGLA
ncbi:hypothetical protein KCU91_g14207, partial [Aureobasidium melanogenum]